MKIFNKALILSCFLISSCIEKEATKTEVLTLTETTKSWNGDKLPNYLEGNPKITILKIIIPPKTTLKIHEHPVINAGVLIKGELTVVDKDNNRLILKAGEAIVEVVNTFHYGKNEGDEAAEIIVFYAGTENSPITVYDEKKQ